MEPAAAVPLLNVAVLHLLCGLSIDRRSFALVAIHSALDFATMFARPLTGTWISRLFRQIPSDTRTTIIFMKVLTFYRDQSSEIWASCVGPTSLPSGVRREDELPRIFLRIESM